MPSLHTVVPMIKDNFKAINANIQKCAKVSGRILADINLVAVSKRQPPENIKAALDFGHRLFGENKVQEAQAHWAHLKPQYPDLKLHLIGPLQTNKIKEAVALFDVIETVDREKLARKLGVELQKTGKNTPCFIQVNTGEEAQKSGILPKDLTAFLHYCTDDCGLNIQGLMCIPPADDPAAPHFALLRQMAQNHSLSCLSMGMSADYEYAICLGATHIRVGTALFGARSS